MFSVSKKTKKLPKYLTKTKIDEMLERARNDNNMNYEKCDGICRKS